MFEVPDNVRPLRDKVAAFLETEIYPVEKEIEAGPSGFSDTMRSLRAKAKQEDIWALGHPKEIGGGGLPFLDYVYVNEVIGRSHSAQLALGTATLQTALMLHGHASEGWRERALLPMVDGQFEVSFAMTEPDVPGSDPTGAQTTATLDGDEWIINGRKWFISLLALAKYTVIMCRTEPPGTRPHRSYSMIIVPNDAPGFEVVRDIDVMGLQGDLSGHYEIAFHDLRVPATNLIGERGAGFKMAQDRLGPGRIFHCMRWLGQAQRAFDLMCRRAQSRMLAGQPLATRQLIQQHVFDSYTDLKAARLMVLDAAAKIDAGEQARVEIGAVKVVCSRMVYRVVDRAIQVHGAAGVSGDLPLERMYRNVRTGRIVDGPDEVHIQRVGRLLLDEYAGEGTGWDFGLR